MKPHEHFIPHELFYIGDDYDVCAIIMSMNYLPSHNNKQCNRINIWIILINWTLNITNRLLQGIPNHQTLKIIKCTLLSHEMVYSAYKRIVMTRRPWVRIPRLSAALLRHRPHTGPLAHTATHTPQHLTGRRSLLPALSLPGHQRAPPVFLWNANGNHTKTQYVVKGAGTDFRRNNCYCGSWMTLITFWSHNNHSKTATHTENYNISKSISSAFCNSVYKVCVLGRSVTFGQWKMDRQKVMSWKRPHFPTFFVWGQFDPIQCLSIKTIINILDPLCVVWEGLGGGLSLCLGES